MSQESNYRERAARCAQSSSNSSDERAKQIWREMENYWEVRASNKSKVSNVRDANAAVGQLFNNLMRITRHFGQPKVLRQSGAVNARRLLEDKTMGG